MREPLNTSSNRASTEVEATLGRRADLAARWAGLLAGYCAVVTLLSLLRLYLRDWGFSLTQTERTSLYSALVAHLALALPLVLGARVIPRQALTGKARLRILAIATPFVLLASADRILAYFIPPLYSQSELYVPDDELGWRHRPGARPGQDRTVEINAKGLRGPELPYAKADDEYRVVFLGDSLAFALGLDYEESFVARIEKAANCPSKEGTGSEPVTANAERNKGLKSARALSQQAPSAAPASKRVATVNMAVSGYSPWQEHLFLKREGLKYEPDLVVQCFCLNDVTVKFDVFALNPHFESLVASSPLEWSGLYRCARRVIMGQRLGTGNHADAARWADQGASELIEAHDAEYVRRAWDGTLAGMRKLIELCRQRQIPLVVVCFPFEFQLKMNEGDDYPQRALERFCKQQRVSFLDLLPAMRRELATTGQRKPLFTDGCHLSPAGHALAAKRIVEFLHREGLFPS